MEYKICINEAKASKKNIDFVKAIIIISYPNVFIDKNKVFSGNKSYLKIEL